MPALRAVLGVWVDIMSASDYVHVQVAEIVHETDRALLLRLEDDRELWCPLSVVADPDDYNKGDLDVTVSIKRWWADKNDLGE